MASGGDQFAISDLEPYYFGWYNEESGEESLISYIYTDRPVYRPGAEGLFQRHPPAARRKWIREPGCATSSVTIEDPKDGKLLERELTLSPRGTFSGEVDIAAGAPLGGYRIVAKAGEDEASGYFEVAEYKKPEYKVTVTTPKKFVAGR